MNCKVVISFLLGLVFVLSPVFAVNYSVSVSVTPKSVTTKPCGIATFDIDIENLGELEDTYAIEVSGIPEHWYTLTHESITVEPKKTEKAYLFITPYCYEKEYAPRYNGTVSIIGKANATDTFALFVVPDHVIKLTMPENVTVCLGEEVEIVGILENTGNYTEDVTFVASGSAADFAKLPEEVVTINPTKTSNVTIRLSPIEVNIGVYTLEVEARSQTSYAKSLASIKVQVVKCYDVEVTYPKEVQACAGKSKTFEIGIKNIGLKADTYTLTIEDLNYSTNVSLAPGESKVLSLDFYQEVEGTYEINFTVTSEFVEKEGTIRFVVIKCYGVDLTVEENEFQIESGKGKLVRGKVTNIGLMADTWKIISDVIWSSIRPEEVTLASNESKNIYAYYSPEYGAKGVYYTNLTAKSDNSQDTEELKIEVVPKELVTTTTIEETTIPIENVTTTEIVENITTTIEETTVTEENVTTTLPPIIPTGEAIAALWENRVFRSLLISIIIVIIILIIIYLVVMR